MSLSIMSEEFLKKVHVPGCCCDQCNYVTPQLQHTSTSSPAISNIGIKAAKAAMTHIYDFKAEVKRGKGSRKANKLVSKPYNTVAGRPLVKRSLRLPEITTMLSLTINLVTTSVTVPTYSGTAFVLSSFGNYSEFISLFDQYRIDELEVWIEPNVSQSTTIGGLGTLTSCIDTDDGNTPTTVAMVGDRATSLTTEAFTGHYHKWRPHVATALYSGTFTSYGNTPSCWIDSASPGVQHFGIKTASLASSATINYYLTARAIVSFKSPGI